MSLELTSLVHELPDPNQELLVHAFNLFPRLPIELRLKVWRETWRNRIIYTWTNWSKTTIPLPVSSQINRESRQETRRYYRVLQFEVDSTKKPRGIAWCANDILRTSLFFLMVDVDNEWQLPFRDASSEFLRAVKNLQVSSCVWTANKPEHFRVREQS